MPGPLVTDHEGKVIPTGLCKKCDHKARINDPTPDPMTNPCCECAIHPKRMYETGTANRFIPHVHHGREGIAVDKVDYYEQ